MKSQNYFIGLDIGTNSVGYAVTDEDHNLIKFKGEPMWGSHIFEEASQCAERRTFRTARRRLNRRKQRVRLVQEIFASEIAKIDENFFVRLKESALFAEDKTNKENFSFFADEDFTDREFHRQYPTIHHLIMSLIEDKTPHDARLVYMAVAWLVAHRGHFLCQVAKDNVKAILDFDTVYQDLLEYAKANDLEIYLTEEMSQELQEILLCKETVTSKKDKIKSILFDGKEEKPNEDTFISQKELTTLLAGGQTDTAKLFPNLESDDKQSVSLAKSEEEFEALVATLDEENAEILKRLRSLYEWSLLSDAVAGEEYISLAKKKVYDIHKQDLADLKYLVKKYMGTDGMKLVFKSATADNYVAYIYNLKGLSTSEQSKVKKTTKEGFCDFVKKILKNISSDDKDKALLENIRQRAEAYSFMPKQVNGDNRVIPYQLYYVELRDILQNASSFLPFLTQKDNDGFTPMEKILSIMEFRIPYFVGPLHRDKSSKFAWITKKTVGTIRPWNFEKMVDLEKCEEDFINRLTGSCTYMVGEDVLPRYSMLYEKYTVLNEINKLKLNGEAITVEAKQKIFNELFTQRRNVTPKQLEKFMLDNGMKQKEDILSGIDMEYKINASLASYHDFKRLIQGGTLTEEQAERIIEHITYVSDSVRLKKWLEREFAFLSPEDKRYISRLHYADFGRLSKRFLVEKFAEDRHTGLKVSVIEALWNTNCNLMELLHHEDFTFGTELENYRKEYYAANPPTVKSIMEELYISNAVKRPIFRTLDIISDIEKVMGHAPSKIFVEMARGGVAEKKRTKSRQDQIKEYYKAFKGEETAQLLKELNSKTNNELQSRKLFLYFMQLGKCMYSGEAINIEDLTSKHYDIEHIFPQCYVKDDSLDNIVLVKTELNGAKSDTYPIDKEIRHKMYGYWKSLLDKNLISKKKFERLTRSKPFTDEERQGFINRQLVETRQSTKAVAEILQARYEKQLADGKIASEPEIVYVKAGLVSDFRHEFGVPKARTVNDLHHAKDAFLNIICGDVYNSRFTKNFIKLRGGDTKYSIKTDVVFGKELHLGNRLVWRGVTDKDKAVATLMKNNIHLTRFAFERRGGLFDQNPIPAPSGMLPRKKGLDIAKYGGYDKTACSFFLLIAYTECGKRENRDLMLVSVDLMVADRVKQDKTFALAYAEQEIKRIYGIKEVKDVTLPLGLRPIKINTVLCCDGIKFAITGKSSAGKGFIFISLTPLIVDKFNNKKSSDNWEGYVKHLERFLGKNEGNETIVLDKEHDGISRQKNEELYDLLLHKITCYPFANMLSSQISVLEKGFDIFKSLDTKTQVKALTNILGLFMTNRSGACDLTAIDGVKMAGVLKLSTKLSNIFKKYKSVIITDTSASGLFEKSTDDLRSLL